MRRSYIPVSLVGKVNDRQAYLLSAIKWQIACKAVKSSGYAPLRNDYLRAVLGHRGAGRTVEECLAAGWIERDNRWMAGKESMGYRIVKRLAKERLEARPFEDPELEARIVTWQEARIRTAIDGRPERQFVYDNLGRLGFRRGMMGVLTREDLTIDQLNCRIQSIGKVEDRAWWFSADKNTDRIFHNVSTMPGECRDLLLIDGQPVAETDISNSQPFILSSLYPGPSPERTRYLDLCVSGGFYEHLNGMFEQPFTSRDELKVAVYQSILYGRQWHLTQPTFQAFAAAFPILAGLVAATKVGKGAHKNLPLAMQKLEAGIILGAVVPRIIQEAPEWRCLTIHDSLLLPARYSNDAAEVIRQELVKQFGVSPPVKIKEPRKVKLASKN